MAHDSSKAEVASLLKELGIASIAPDWSGCDAVWGVLELMAQEGAVVLVKIDGERTGRGDTGRYTVVVSGAGLGGDFFRLDTAALEEGLAKAIIYYAKKVWS